MKIYLPDGILAAARYLSSPHCDERPDHIVIDTLVVHGISLPPAHFGKPYIEQFFCGKLDSSIHPYFATIAQLKVSAHLLVTRRGEIIQFVPFSQRAWHAGESCFKGRIRCNDFSIGIELEGTDDLPYEKIQYEQLAKISQVLMQTYPALTQDRIIGHADIAPGRKTDPGPLFNWDYLHCLLGS